MDSEFVELLPLLVIEIDRRLSLYCHNNHQIEEGLYP